MPDLFATIRAKRLEAEDALLNACLSIIVTERLIAKDDKAIGALQGLRDELALAARDLTNAVDDSPIPERPKRWHQDESGRTA